MGYSHLPDVAGREEHIEHTHVRAVSPNRQPLRNHVSALGYSDRLVKDHSGADSPAANINNDAVASRV